MLPFGQKIIEQDIVPIEVEYINFDDDIKKGILEVHKEVKDEVVSIFKEIKDINFPIYQIFPIVIFNFSDKESIIANNTSSFNFRFVAGSKKFSDHAIGLAIDINPKQNPWVHPSALNLFKYEVGVKGTIEVGSDIVAIFEKYGWSWGGYWKNPDYQHFYKGGEINNKIKSELLEKIEKFT
jgi:hypothetical protein